MKEKKNNEKVCSCFGHLEVAITDELRARTEEEVDKAIADGVRVFMFGEMSNFDDLVYDIVSKKKAQDPQLEIKRVYCAPLYPQRCKPPNKSKKKEYEEYEYPVKPIEMWFTSIYYRNRAMIDESDLVIVYAEKKDISVVYRSYLYALEANKKTVNLYLPVK